MKNQGLRLLVLMLLAACSHAPGTTREPRPADTTDVEVTIASATLASDCGSAMDSSSSKGSAVAGKCAPGSDCNFSRHCTQTQMQLELTGGTLGSGAQVGIRTVELLDDQDRVIGTLTSRNPQQWSESESTYQPWAQAINPSERVLVSYDLSEPDFSEVGGQWEAQNKSFRLRVTLDVISGDQHTTTKVVGSAQLYIEAPVVT